MLRAGARAWRQIPASLSGSESRRSGWVSCRGRAPTRGRCRTRWRAARNQFQEHDAQQSAHRRCPASSLPTDTQAVEVDSAPQPAADSNFRPATAVAPSPWAQQPLAQRGRRMGDTASKLAGVACHLPPRRQLLWRLRLDGRAADPAVASAMGLCRWPPRPRWIDRGGFPLWPRSPPWSLRRGPSHSAATNGLTVCGVLSGNRLLSVS